MDSKEIVKRAIHFKNPPRLPRFWYKDHDDDSDILLVPLRKWYEGLEENEAELGFVWAKADTDKMSMGVPKEYPLKDWDDFENYVKNVFPDPYAADRFKLADSMDFSDKYIIADLYLSGFTGMWLIRGFHEVLSDMCVEPERFNKLADLIFDFETEIIRQCAAYNFDCVYFADDWGMQSTMMISPEMWREHFKERYKKQFQLCHELGMDVYFHTCGYVYPILQDFIDIGVDIFHLGQVNVNNIKKVGEDFSGKVCFCATIDYQSTGPYGTKEEIFDEAKELIDNLCNEHGGLFVQLLDYETMGYANAIAGNTMLAREAFISQDPYVNK